MSGIAEVLLNLGYQRVAARTWRSNAATAAPGAAGRARRDRPRGREHRRRRRRRRVDGGRTRQSGSAWPRAQRTIPIVPRAMMLGRTDAPEAGHRDRRHARQDHDHQPGRQRAGARAGSIRPSSSAAASTSAGANAQAGHGRLHRGRGRRVGRVVPEPVAGDRGHHEHRRRPHGNLRPRLRAS